MLIEIECIDLLGDADKSAGWRSLRNARQSHLLYQRIARRGELLESLRAAAAIRMRSFGRALPGLMDFRRGQAGAVRPIRASAGSAPPM